MDVSVSPSNPRYSCPTRTNCPCQGVTYIYSWRTTERQVPQHDHMRFEFGIDAAIFFDLPDNVVHSYIIAIVIQKNRVVQISLYSEAELGILWLPQGYDWECSGLVELWFWRFWAVPMMYTEWLSFRIAFIF